jgi:hypothetical protein
MVSADTSADTILPYYLAGASMDRHSGWASNTCDGSWASASATLVQCDEGGDEIARGYHEPKVMRHHLRSHVRVRQRGAAVLDPAGGVTQVATINGFCNFAYAPRRVPQSQPDGDKPALAVLRSHLHTTDIPLAKAAADGLLLLVRSGPDELVRKVRARQPARAGPRQGAAAARPAAIHPRPSIHSYSACCLL